MLVWSTSVDVNLHTVWWISGVLNASFTHCGQYLVWWMSVVDVVQLYTFVSVFVFVHLDQMHWY